MANELRYHGTPGWGNATVRFNIKIGATRWNGAAMVAASTIHDNAWPTGMATGTEQLTADGTGNGEYVADMPAGLVALNVAGIVDYDVYENAAPTPIMRPDGSGWFNWSGSAVIVQTGDAYASVATLLKYAAADLWIDATTTPWSEVVIVRGTGAPGIGTELVRRRLFKTDNTNVGNQNDFVGHAMQ